MCATPSSTPNLIHTRAIYAYLIASYCIWIIIVYDCSILLVDIVITRNPADTEACLGNVASMPCGFTGADPHITIPEWIRIIRKADGRTQTIIIPSGELIAGSYPGHRWEPDLTSGPLNATGSKLLIGPVDETYDQSVYVCSFATIGGTIKSNPGILRTIGKIEIYT